MSICFNCLFLVSFFFHYYCLFVSLRKEEKSNLFTFVLFVCFSKRPVRCVFSKKDKKKRRRKNKEDGVSCMFKLSNYLSTFSFCFVFCELMLCFFLCRRLFLYLFIKRLCVSISFYYLLRVCV